MNPINRTDALHTVVMDTSKKTQKFEISFPLSIQCFQMPNSWLRETFDSVRLQLLMM